VNFHFSLRANCTDFIAKDEWPPNSSDFNPLDYHVWGCIGRNASGISQTSLKAKDHSGAKKADLG